MGLWRRHAIYFAPDPGTALHAFGATWLGWDPNGGAAGAGGAPAGGQAGAADAGAWAGKSGAEAERTKSPVPGLTMPRDAIVATPARYGLHATLKAPFRLAEGSDAADLDRAAAAIAAGCPRFALRLTVARIGGFVALVPEGTPPPALVALERALVTGLDPLRAPLTEAEVARRGTLGPAEAAALARWGYPYVLDSFRFHVTLTGSLPEPAGEAVQGALADALEPMLQEPVAVDAVWRFAEAEDGFFHAVARHPLG